MADFCQQCSIELFREDYKDLANLMAPDQYDAEKGMGCKALCEDCGMTVVDINGKCIYKYCPKHGDKADAQSQ